MTHLSRNLYLFLLSMLILCSFATVQAASPFQGAQFSEGFVIKVPTVEVVKYGEHVDLDFHVFNISNGRPINSNIGCYLHVYNRTGNHIMDAFTSTVEHTFDYSFLVNAKNFSYVGEYYYNIQCNHTTLGGFESQTIYVTKTGSMSSTFNGIQFFAIEFIILITAGFFFVLGLRFQNPAVKIIFIGLGALFLFIAVLSSMVILDQTAGEFPDIVDGFATFLTVTKILIGIFIVALLITVMVFAYNMWQVRRGFT